jgi:hypothetical protein
MASRSTAKTQRYRARLRAQGLRPIQLWVPDTRDPAVCQAIRRDVAALRGHPSSREGDEFVEAALADLEGWTA